MSSEKKWVNRPKKMDFYNDVNQIHFQIRNLHTKIYYLKEKKHLIFDICHFPQKLPQLF